MRLVESAGALATAEITRPREMSLEHAGRCPERIHQPFTGVGGRTERRKAGPEERIVDRELPRLRLASALGLRSRLSACVSLNAGWADVGEADAQRRKGNLRHRTLGFDPRPVAADRYIYGRPVCRRYGFGSVLQGHAVARDPDPEDIVREHRHLDRRSAGLETDRIVGASDTPAIAKRLERRHRFIRTDELREMG